MNTLTILFIIWDKVQDFNAGILQENLISRIQYKTLYQEWNNIF